MAADAQRLEVFQSLGLMRPFEPLDGSDMIETRRGRGDFRAAGPTAELIPLVDLMSEILRTGPRLVALPDAPALVRLLAIEPWTGVGVRIGEGLLAGDLEAQAAQ